ncbi:MAG: thiamine diphosphokinase [Calditrichaeota bacterium]|nr:thiamine diphosphokinase [Calditrichota bacterium]MCB9368016.1 thiamine diphosphokinase [Calditrichota bacterium]
MSKTERIGTLLPSEFDALIVANGSLPNRELLLQAVGRSRHIVAVDGGIRHLRGINIPPDIVIGDLDSAAHEDITWARRRRAHVLFRESQESSDIDKVLALCKQRKWRTVAVAAIEGSRPDHFLYGISKVISTPGLTTTFLFRRAVGLTMKGRSSREVVLRKNSVFSWIAMDSATGVTLTGAKWPLRNAALSVDARQSLSNTSLGGVVSFSQRSGKSLIIIPIGKV